MNKEVLSLKLTSVEKKGWTLRKGCESEKIMVMLAHDP